MDKYYIALSMYHKCLPFKDLNHADLWRLAKLNYTVRQSRHMGGGVFLSTFHYYLWITYFSALWNDCSEVA